MQGTISPGLQKLMQSVQELKQVSSPQTSSGAPTIAAQVEQAASQVAAQAAPPAEMPGMLPNDPYRAQLMQTLQAQAQEQAQRMAMLAQGQPPQGRAEGGIASLPGADVKMAEGGVVGFSGEFGSVVPEAAALDELRIAEEKRRLEANAIEARRRIEEAERLRTLEFLEQAGSPLAQRYRTPNETGVPSDAQSAPQMTPQQRERFTPALPEQTPAPRPPGGQRQNTSVQRQQPAATPAADKGIAALVGPPVPSGSERQFGEALSVAGRVDPGKARTPEQIRAEIDAVYRARGIEPGKAERERLAKLEAFDAQEEAERKKRVEQRGMQDLITFLTGFGGASSMVEGGRRGSAASSQLQQEWARSDEAFNLLKRQRMDAIAAERVALDNRNRALADGDIAKAATEEANVRAAKNAQLTAEAKMRADFAAPMMQAETAAMQEAGRAREGVANRANAIELERMRRATADRPGETERIFNRFNELKAKDPAAAEAYLQDIERIKGAGRGITERQDVNELKALIASLRDQADPMKNMDKPSREQAAAMLKQAQEKLAQMSGLGGSSSAQLPAAAVSQLKEGIVTTFANGQQWTLKNGQPSQVK